MEYCKYHPLEAATYACHFCRTNQCDCCINENEHTQINRCFICEQEVECLGAVNQVEPFWRRLEQSFRYPMNKNGLTLITIVAVMSLLLSYLPVIFSIILTFALIGTFLKYCFSCLKNSSNGDLAAPDMADIYEGGLDIAGRLILILLFLLAMNYTCYQLFGQVIGNVVSIIMTISLPAVFINFALTEDISESVNPLSMLRLIMAIGLPYGLLLAFILIMFASAGILNEIIGDSFFVVSSVLQFMVINYYLIVLFHIMGYMVFQYQNVLGYSARFKNQHDNIIRSEKDKILANIDVNVKEGNYQQTINLFRQACKEYTNDEKLYGAYFEFIIAIKASQEIKVFEEKYFYFLSKTNHKNKIAVSYKRILLVDSKFCPSKPETRLLIAKACYKKGEPKLAIKLLIGLHKECVDFSGLVDAYELLAECFDDLPNMSNKAEQCRQLVKKLKIKHPSFNKQQKKATSTFSSIDNLLTQSQGIDEDSEVNNKTQKSELDDGKDKTAFKPQVEDLPPIDFY